LKGIQPATAKRFKLLAPLAFLNRDPHVANMSIDSKRLTKDCANAQAAMAANGLARRRTGATAVIEPLLPIIRELRARKHSWAAIAAALAKQGVVQGNDREPIAGRLLTALICAINKRVRRQEERWKRNGANNSEVADLLGDKSEAMGKHYTRHVESEVNVIRAFTRVKDAS
jgi:hypothetical protein